MAPTSGGVRRIVLLTLGWEELPKSVSVHGSSPAERLREPVPGVLLQTDGGWVLLDTGFNTALIRDPALRRRFYPSVEYQPILPGPGEPIEEALADIGVDVDDIHLVALSHLHVDHAGGLKLFAGKMPVHAQRREVEYGLSNHPESERHAIFRIDFDDPAIDWRLADGEAEIAPGITAVPTYGHTPGGASELRRRPRPVCRRRRLRVRVRRRRSHREHRARIGDRRVHRRRTRRHH